MNKLKEVKELQIKLADLSSKIHYSYAKEEKVFNKIEKVFKDEAKLPSYLQQLSLSSGKIDTSKYNSFISNCHLYKDSIMENISTIKQDLPDRINKNHSCINSAGLVGSSDIPEFKTFTVSQQNLTYNFLAKTYTQGYEHYLDHIKGKKINFRNIKDDLKSFIKIIKEVKNDKNVLSSNLPILTQIEFDLEDILQDYQENENVSISIMSSYDDKVEELLLTNTGSFKKVA